MKNPFEELKEDSEESKGTVLKPMRLLSKIDELKGGKTGLNEIRDKAFVSFLYLSACRVEECVQYIKEIARHKPEERDIKGEYIMRTGIDGKKYPAEEREHISEPLRRDSIVDFHDHLLVTDVRNLKRRDKIPPRPIPIFKGELEMPFIKHLKRYIDTLDPNLFMFDFTRQRAFQILEDIGINPHQLRHTRLTHLCTFYPFSLFDLQNFVAWKSIKSADSYVHLTKEDILVKFRSVGVAEEI